MSGTPTDAAATKTYVKAEEKHLKDGKPADGIIFYNKNEAGDGPKEPAVPVDEPDPTKLGDYVVEDTTAVSSSGSSGSTNASPELIAGVVDVLKTQGIDPTDLSKIAADKAAAAAQAPPPDAAGSVVEADDKTQPQPQPPANGEVKGAAESASIGGRRRTKRKGRKGSKKSKKGAKKSKKSSQSNQSQNGGRSRKNRRKHSRRRKH
jgi:hypothetical protein